MGEFPLLFPPSLVGVDGWMDVLLSERLCIPEARSRSLTDDTGRAREHGILPWETPPFAVNIPKAKKKLSSGNETMGVFFFLLFNVGQ